jgi:REP element-mobilizing transposase RayT
LISIPPKYAVSQVVGFIKGKSAIHLARVYGEKNMTALSPNPSASWATPPHGNAVTVGYRPE